MKKDPKIFVSHILDSIKLIEEYSKNMTQAKFLKPGMRDILIHEYFDVDLFLTWKVVKQELPLIKKQLSEILSQ